MWRGTAALVFAACILAGAHAAAQVQVRVSYCDPIVDCDGTNGCGNSESKRRLAIRLSYFVTTGNVADAQQAIVATNKIQICRKQPINAPQCPDEWIVYQKSPAIGTLELKNVALVEAQAASTIEKILPDCASTPAACADWDDAAQANDIFYAIVNGGSGVHVLDAIQSGACPNY